ncbi:adaptor protein MecA [Psychrobacillus vulpis]|uniref:Adapter protein MecA n=1 Tax=Psychrobacillus vulpis TaxID=2325572 RepID=A0A544TRY2_9BACI|nr:adaptor protein MecA [Psychrobacillus vulpis]TQR20217.1 adaptor protein MecA [Psychrobacillus vulpis]
MDIERINDNTFKVYISYIDIEERGFSRDEIWFNKDKSEQLFWEMMDEVHDDDHFDDLDGPLWIQVHAMEKGLEVIVTRTEMTKGDDRSESSFEIEDHSNKIFKNGATSSIGPHEFEDFPSYLDDMEELPLEYTFVFDHFDDLLPLAKKLNTTILQTSLYHYEEKYYLHVHFNLEVNEIISILDTLSVISEFASRTSTTIHIIQEYGKEIITNDVFKELNKFF